MSTEADNSRWGSFGSSILTSFRIRRSVVHRYLVEILAHVVKVSVKWERLIHLTKTLA